MKINHHCFQRLIIAAFTATGLMLIFASKADGLQAAKCTTALPVYVFMTCCPCSDGRVICPCNY